MSAPQNYLEVDWSALPTPEDDGAAAHLPGVAWPDLALDATDGAAVNLASAKGVTVVFIYPRTGRPGVAMPDGWDEIPGARGCTPHSCAFRDLHQELTGAGAARVFGLSTQDSAYQRELVERLHLPFPILSDAAFALTQALSLPTFEAAGERLLKRMALIVEDGRIIHVFYPVFPPDRNAGDVLAWLRARG